MITLDLRANTRLRRLKEHVRKLKPKASKSNLQLLKSAVVYGANASGKSNLIKAISFMQDYVLEGSFGDGIQRNTFKFYQEDKPSNFYIEFIVSTVRVGYMFQINDNRVTYEKLMSIGETMDITVFERSYDAENDRYHLQSDFAFDDDVKSQKIWDEFETLADFCPENKLLVTEINDKNAKVLESKLGDFSYIFLMVHTFFKYKVVIIFPDTKYSALGRDIVKEKYRKEYSEILNKFDTGVSDLRVIPVSRSYFQNSMIESLENRLRETKRDFMPFEYNGDEYYVSFNKEKNIIELFSVVSKHKDFNGVEKDFNIREESDGTIRLLDLIPIIESNETKTGTVFIIDEFDRSLHPNLSKSYFNLFMEKTINNRDQLIVTTHQSELLDNDILRRDEIWFAQKEKDQSTQIYTLDEFNTRADMDIKYAYLNGKFGAIPFIN
ncbi:ATP-binding protein [Vibrio parahaemolyticus]|nr:ATP-binding protein [Vibrio parahaemolyticus]